MELPQEVEVWYVIPALRKGLAKSLLELGLSQKEIAKKLQLTEPAVSQYLKGKRGNDVKFSENALKQIKSSAKKIKVSNSKTIAGKELFRLTAYVRKTCLCKIHKGLEKNRGTCNICKK
ncbi:MAG: helix-turn-helix domain-containing protein [archaeon]